MTSPSMIFGTIDGISKKDFDRLQKDLLRNFDEVGWKDEALSIKSDRIHASVQPVFSRIAACVLPGRFGSLLYVGHGNVACFFFGHNTYVGRKYTEPAPPEWWSPPRP